MQNIKYHVQYVYINLKINIYINWQRKYERFGRFYTEVLYFTLQFVGLACLSPGSKNLYTQLLFPHKCLTSRYIRMLSVYRMNEFSFFAKFYHQLLAISKGADVNLLFSLSCFISKPLIHPAQLQQVMVEVTGNYPVAAGF